MRRDTPAGTVKLDWVILRAFFSKSNRARMDFSASTVVQYCRDFDSSRVPFRRITNGTNRWKMLRHPLGRTVTATDNIWQTLLSVNTNPIHFDAHYAAQTEFGKPLVDSTLTLAIVTGLSVADISRYGVNLGWDEVRLPAPVFEGDTLYAQSQVLSRRESKSRPNMDIVRVKTTGFKQDGTVVMTFQRTILIYKRGHVPARPLPKGEA